MYKNKNLFQLSIINQAWLAITLTALTGILGIILSHIQSKVGWLSLILALVFIFSVLGLCLYMVCRYIYAPSVSLQQEIHNKLESYVDINKVSWVCTSDQLVEIESRIDCEEIWLVSSDFDEDTPGGPFEDVVRANLSRGIKYRFFANDTFAVKTRIEQISRAHNCHQNLKITWLSNDFFFLVPRLDFAIYNPLGGKGSKRIAYMGIPLANEPIMHHAIIDDSLTDVLIGKLLGTEKTIQQIAQLNA